MEDRNMKELRYGDESEMLRTDNTASQDFRAGEFGQL